MKRFGMLVTAGFLTSLVVGCESGLKEGPPSEPVKSSQTDEFRESMKRTGNKMMKGQVRERRPLIP